MDESSGTKKTIVVACLKHDELKVRDILSRVDGIELVVIDKLNGDTHANLRERLEVLEHPGLEALLEFEMRHDVDRSLPAYRAIGGPWGYIPRDCRTPHLERGRTNQPFQGKRRK